MKLTFLLHLILLSPVLFAQEQATLLNTLWNAHWIAVSGTSPDGYGVYHFRRSFDLPSRPDHFVVHVSADNRYQLYINGTRISWGPARGDLAHWRYETLDIAPYLRAGRNVLASVVWNDGDGRAIAQVSNRTGFLLQSDRPENATVNTSRAWVCIEDRAYSPQPLPENERTGYYALGPNERVDAGRYPWRWQKPDFDDSTWQPAQEITRAAGRDARDAPNRWMLVESHIPLEEQRREPDLVVRQATGISLPGHFPVSIPPHTRVSLLFDQAHLTTAYPELTVSGGQGAKLDLRYAETLYVRKAARREPADKGNRDDINGKQFYGPADTYLPDGASHRTYRPLYWRTYRYLQLAVETGSQPVSIEDLHGTFTAYPFHRTAAFTADGEQQNHEIQRILDTGWRTARLCAHEAYMDCPFYEQLQYAGDARIQMLISLYMTGDAHLMKNGIALLNSSRTAEGATYSRAPSNLQQYIPPFSLWWIGMVHDYWMYVDDAAFVKQMLPGVRAVLEFYAGYQKPNGSLKRMPWWNFVDWVKQWPNGVPPAESDGSSSAALDLQLLLAYYWAADLEHAVGSDALSDADSAAATKLKAAILNQDWDSARGLFADQPSHRTYSQQVNTLAVLAHIVEGEQARSVIEKLLTDRSMAQSSIYFRAYTNATLREVGLGGRYLDALGPWRDMLAAGLTTWAEWDGPDARSDCHAWGASPNFEMLRTIAGIESLAPGFQRVRIAPNLGNLHHITASMPHAGGPIRVDLHQTGRELQADIDLPAHLTGEFDWFGNHRALQPGRNHFELFEKASAR